MTHHQPSAMHRNHRTVWIVALLMGVVFCFSCRNKKATRSSPEQVTTSDLPLPTSDLRPPTSDLESPTSDLESPTYDYDTTQWLELVDLDSTVFLDIRYATDNNFVGQTMYACPRCFLRPVVARAVIQAHQELREQGLALKFFDCYRPLEVQWKLWEIYPNPGYVADPRKGSSHNRGGAVDLTIVDAETGEPLAMGTPFDFFGEEAHHTYTEHPAEVLANRQLLKDIMAKYGLAHIRTEWWHYSYRSKTYPIAEKEWNCN